MPVAALPAFFTARRSAGRGGDPVSGDSTANRNRRPTLGLNEPRQIRQDEPSPVITVGADIRVTRPRLVNFVFVSYGDGNLTVAAVTTLSSG